MDKISAFIDGEVSEYEARDAFARLKRERDCCEAWNVYQMIGDTMRGEPGLCRDFAARVCACLDSEPTVLAPKASLRRVARYGMAVAASCAGVAFVLTLLNTTGTLPQSTPTLASNGTSARVASAQPMLKAGSVNEYLMAHQEFSPSTALQGMAPYIRTVAEDSADR